MADWRWNLHRFSDREYLGPLDAISDRTVSPSHNAAGAASFSIDLEDDMAYLIDNHKTYVVVQRDGQHVFSGKIIDTDEDAASGRMSVDCLGWYEIVEHRQTYEDLTFENMSCGRIAWSLLAHSQVNDGDLGFDVGPAQDAGFTIPKITIAKDSSIAEWINKLTAVENGIDFEYDWASDTIKFYSALGVDRPDAHFGYKVGPGNLANIGRKKEGSRKVNKMKAISSRSGNFVIVSNAVSIAETGTYREVESLSGILTADESNVLNAYATGETVLRGDGVTTYRCTPLTPKNEGWNEDVWVPMPWDDYGLADIVRLSVDAGRFQLSEQGARVYGWSVNINDNGDETLASISLSK